MVMYNNNPILAALCNEPTDAKSPLSYVVIGYLSGRDTHKRDSYVDLAMQQVLAKTVQMYSKDNESGLGANNALPGRSTTYTDLSRYLTSTGNNNYLH